MDKLRKTKYQVVTVTIPTTATPGNVIEEGIVLDKDFSHCDGVAVSVEGTLSTLSHVNVGVRDSYATLHDDVHIEQFQASSAVAPNEKFKDLFSVTDGRRVVARVTPPAAPAAQVRIQFTFRLRDDLKVINEA
ncbi:MAG: hypothetical protein ACK52I_22280 [Pseudomonadota bacterium]|jgi:hypothetical protein